jgi:small conductance mechanosensitive channel
MKIHDFNFHDLYNAAYQWLLINGLRVVVGLAVLIIGLKVIKFIGVRIRDRMSKREVHSSLQPFFLSLAITALYVLLII